MTATILSFDIGINNLAYCVCACTGTTLRVEQWGIINIQDYSNQSKVLDDLCLGLIRALDETFDDNLQIETVLLENQPVQKNPTMKSIQMILYTYFQVRKAHMGTVGCVKLMSAINKAKWIPAVPMFAALEIKGADTVEVKNAYKKNKQLSVQMVLALFNGIGVGPTPVITVEASDTMRQVLDSAKKKDDLCDCLLQACKHVMDKDSAKNKPVPRSKKQNANLSQG